MSSNSITLKKKQFCVLYYFFVEYDGTFVYHGHSCTLARVRESRLCWQRRMLRGVLALDDLTVDDVMTHRSRINALDADDPTEKNVLSLLQRC